MHSAASCFLCTSRVPAPSGLLRAHRPVTESWSSAQLDAAAQGKITQVNVCASVRGCLPIASLIAVCA